MSKPQTAPTMLRTPRQRQAVNPAIVWIWWAGPISASVAAFLPKAAANFSRAASVL